MTRIPALAWVAMAACRLGAAPEPPVPIGAPADDTPQPIAGPSSVPDTTVALPAPTFPGLPGWLALATAPEPDGGSPPHPTAAVAIPKEPAAWSALGPVSLVALTPTGRADVTNHGVSEVRFGCDGNTATFAFFAGPRQAAHSALWLAPRDVDVKRVALADAEATPTQREAGPPEHRAWRAGEHTVVTRRTDTSLGIELWRGETRVWEETEPWVAMDGADGVVPTLAGGPGAQTPQFLLEAGPVRALIVHRQSWEGSSYRALFVEGDTARWSDDAVYLYWCAF